MFRLVQRRRADIDGQRLCADARRAPQRLRDDGMQTLRIIRANRRVVVFLDVLVPDDDGKPSVSQTDPLLSRLLFFRPPGQHVYAASVGSETICAVCLNQITKTV